MKSITKPGIKVLMVLLGVLLIVVSVAGCGDKYPKDPVVFADLGWDSALVHNQIAAFILENGYEYPESEFTPGETIPLFAGLERGDIDVNMECWTENQQEAYDKAIAAGTIVDLGENFWDNWQGWLVPTYMIEDGLLPANISVQDMPQYWELFKDPDDPTKGRFYSCIAGWECELINDDKFDVYGLKDTYNVFLPGSGAALLASMVAAYEKGEPWFGYYWAPTSDDAEQRVDLAAGEAELHTVQRPHARELLDDPGHLEAVVGHGTALGCTTARASSRT